MTKKSRIIWLLCILNMPLSNAYGYCAIADVQNTINIKCAILNNTRYEATLVQWYSGYGRLTWYLAHAKVMSMPSNTRVVRW